MTHRPRFEVVEGSYTGTSDDVAGRWYTVDTEADIIDKRGRGYATREDALEAIIERLTAWPAEDRIVGVAEIAERTGSTVNTVHSWRRRHADFPAPVATLAMGPVWLWSDVAHWIARSTRSGRSRTGRRLMRLAANGAPIE